LYQPELGVFTRIGESDFKMEEYTATNCIAAKFHHECSFSSFYFLANKSLLQWALLTTQVLKCAGVSPVNIVTMPSAEFSCPSSQLSSVITATLLLLSSCRTRGVKLSGGQEFDTAQRCLPLDASSRLTYQTNLIPEFIFYNTFSVLVRELNTLLN
jgi:hypothetical protein